MSRGPLRVLMLNRTDAYDVLGGDTVQMSKTANALQELGVEVSVRLFDDLSARDWDTDLVHLFNIQTAQASWQACEQSKSRGLPVVLSPIYWDPLEAWFSAAPDKKRIWRLVRHALGYRLGFWVYAIWQRSRYRDSATWQAQRQLLLSADALVPNSRAEASQLARDYMLPASRQRSVVLVPNAVDKELFQGPCRRSAALESQLGTGFALEVGRVSPEKNSLMLMEALWDVDINIVYVGQPSPYDPAYVDECRRRAAQRGRVQFVGSLPHQELPGVYGLAAVHALPSWRETPGLASLEAAAAGCRVVSTSIGSASEYFGSDADYCHPADARSIRHAVLSALHRPTPSGLRDRVLTSFTWERAAAATLSAYTAVVGS